MTDMPFREVREPHTGRLLFRYDPDRCLIEIQQRRIKVLVDLQQYARETTERETEEGVKVSDY